jgi:hypothetical protein
MIWGSGLILTPEEKHDMEEMVRSWPVQRKTVTSEIEVNVQVWLHS